MSFRYTLLLFTLAPACFAQLFTLDTPTEQAATALTLEAVPSEKRSDDSSGGGFVPVLGTVEAQSRADSADGGFIPTLASVEAESRALDSRHDLSDSEREIQRARLQRDYEIAMRMLEMQKASEERKEEANRQGAAFTREYLQLDPTADDFHAKFVVLESKYPLAIEEPLSRKLIERARRQISRDQVERAEAVVGVPPVGD